MSNTKVPASYMDIMSQKKAFAHLATLMPDGSPQVTPVWFVYKDGKFIVNTARGRVKDRNMKQERARSRSRSSIRTTPTRTSPSAARSSTSPRRAPTRTSTRWPRSTSGRTSIPSAQPGEVRVIYEIEPTSVSAMG